jgi:hypothetical protein
MSEAAMLSLSKITCPHCGAGLKSSRALPVGKQVTCVRCQAPFTITRADGGAESPLANDLLPESCVIPIDDRAASETIKQHARYCKLDVGNATQPSMASHQGVAEPPRMGIPVGTGSHDTPWPVKLSAYPPVTPPPLPIPLPSAPLVTPPSGNGAKAGAIVAVLAVCLAIGISGILIFSDDTEPPAEPRARNDTASASTPVPAVTPPATAQAKPPAASIPTAQPSEGATENPAAPVVKEADSRDVPVAPVVVKEEAPPPHPEQKRIDRAIEQGIDYLKKQQSTWLKRNDVHTVGFTALPGLTLLECGVKKHDPVIQKVAAYLRNPKTTDNLRETYDLALAILFLDRLGDKADSPLIRTLALRLVAGQTSSGGWDYACPILTDDHHFELFNYLHDTRPQPQLFNPVTKGREPEKPARESAKEPQKPKAELLTEFVRSVAVVQDHLEKKGKGDLRRGMDDNSNTQFAMLALWAARRHDVPSERSLALCKKRFMKWQHPNGGWGYRVHMGATPSMTCVGLLGLALGHGASDEGLLAAFQRLKKENLPNVAKEDPAIQKGLAALGAHIGSPHIEENVPPTPDLYFLWSVERVAMLYNLPTIGNKDWYSWGVSVLLPNQRANGSWLSAPYPGHPAHPAIDSCFAMLFLKRSNLVSDLTENLRLYIAIPDPGKRQ